jgi:hypothetical protein
MAAPPADPEPSREPLDLTAEETVWLLTNKHWTAELLALFFQMSAKAGQVTFFKAIARLLDLYVAAEAVIERMGEIGAELKAHPAAALARKRRGTTSKKPWREVLLTDKELMRRVLDPADERAKLARTIEKRLEKQGVKHPLAQAIDRWIEDQRERAAAQAR